MADLSCNFAGIKSPNPFWLASAPPTDKKYNVERAFAAGWGGVVWKTLGEEGPPIVNVSSRYSSISHFGHKMIGMNNIELITDRPLEVNLREIKEVKDSWPDRAVVVSLMVPCEESSWKSILEKVSETGADGVELNFGCPHGMSERGMGAAVGQVPEYVEMVTKWCKQYCSLPVVVKLTPNVTNINLSAEAAKRGGADGVSLINTINSITGIDLDNMVAYPVVDGKSTHGGYCGPAVKPIALHMVSEVSKNRFLQGMHISGIGGIGNWKDAAEFLALGCLNVQVCTAAMHYGFQIVEDMITGLNHWMDEKNYECLNDFVGKAVINTVNWQELNLNYISKAKINASKCIGCGLCYKACEDTSHQAIKAHKIGLDRVYEVVAKDCVGCNLCQLACPVPDCIEMLDASDQNAPYLPWTRHPNNPFLKQQP